MSHKSILFLARSAQHIDFVSSLSTAMDVEVHTATPEDPSITHDFDLMILESAGVSSKRIDSMLTWLDDRGGIPMLLLVEDAALPTLRLPNHGQCDFISTNATLNELIARVSRFCECEETAPVTDVVRIDNLVINTATYQVTLDEKPIDLTLMEYSLLAFLATHPNRAFSRETLLHRVWGFEYCGGTRTVDVHIRRIRSKVGPLIAAHIDTVRGVGYLFKL